MDQHDRQDAENSNDAKMQACEDFLVEIVNSSWRQLKSMLAEQCANVRIVAQSVPQALADTQAQGLHAFRLEVSREIEPIAAAVAGFSARPLVSAFLRPLCRAHRAAIVLWWDTLQYVLKHNALSSPQLAYFFRDTLWKRGVLLPAFQHVSLVPHRSFNAFTCFRSDSCPDSRWSHIAGRQACIERVEKSQYDPCRPAGSNAGRQLAARREPI